MAPTYRGCQDAGLAVSSLGGAATAGPDQHGALGEFGPGEARAFPAERQEVVQEQRCHRAVPGP